MPSATPTPPPAPSSISSPQPPPSTPSGARHIPPTTRADGTLRKEIKIRPGYRPPEEIEVYKNRTAEAWKTRGSSGNVPGAEGLGDGGGVEGRGGKGKNAKRREARRRAKGGEGKGDGGVEEGKADEETGEEKRREAVARWNSGDLLTASSSVGSRPAPQEQGGKGGGEDEGAEGEREARKLLKKLRQARELKEREEGGGVLLPEQFAKVIKIQELIRQLDGLGFDEEGGRKGGDGERKGEEGG